jgi:DNA-binding CsgD family transcriptional regulator
MGAMSLHGALASLRRLEARPSLLGLRRWTTTKPRACDVDDETRTFACELKPINRNADPKALAVSGLSLEALEQSGLRCSPTKSWPASFSITTPGGVGGAGAWRSGCISPGYLAFAADAALWALPGNDAARALRESGATPTQVKVGVQLALGKTKPIIADELGVQLSSVADLTRRLYQTLDVHNSAELGTKIWLGQRQTGRSRLVANV